VRDYCLTDARRLLTQAGRVGFSLPANDLVILRMMVLVPRASESSAKAGSLFVESTNRVTNLPSQFGFELAWHFNVVLTGGGEHA
jgi:hypothetical protein